LSIQSSGQDFGSPRDGDSVVEDLPALPFTIAAGQTQPFSVRFSPVAGSSGARAGSISFTSGINNVSQSFSGTGSPDVLLSWGASTTPSVTYNVYRCSTSASACVQSSPSNFTRIATGISGLTYTDLSVTTPNRSRRYHTLARTNRLPPR